MRRDRGRWKIDEQGIVGWDLTIIYTLFILEQH
jgi:hypothetical protein